MKLDFAQLLANAIRDRVDGDPLSRVEGLIEALSDVRAVFPSPSPQDQISLDSVHTLARCLRSKLARRNRLS